MMATDHSSYVHGNALVVGDRGVLIRGVSGSGKSALTLALWRLACLQGHFAALIGDDRVRFEVHHGRLLAFGHRSIVGLIEQRTIGLLQLPTVETAVIHLVVELADQMSLVDRFPVERMLEVSVQSVYLRCLELPCYQTTSERAESVFMNLYPMYAKG